MSVVYLVVEGENTSLILKHLLPDRIVEKTEFVVAHGRYAAQSLATTLLATRGIPLALVVDADSHSPTAVEEQIDLLRWLLRQSAGNVPFEIFVVIPEIEVVLLYDKQVFERMIRRTLSDAEWALAQRSPKQALLSLGREPIQVQEFLAELTGEEVRVLQHHSLLRALRTFLAAQIGGEDGGGA